MSVFTDVPKGYECRMRVLQAIAALASTKTLSAMTVNDICAAAGVSRTTFYRTFTDKYEAITWYHQFLGTDSVSNIGRTLTCHEGGLKMNRSVYEDRNFYANIYGGDYEELASLGARMTSSIYRKTIVEYNGGVISDMLDFEIDSWASSLYRAVARWVRSGFAEDPETMTAYMDDIRPRLLTQTLDAPVLARRG